MVTNILLLFVLILVNGLFAMSEIAIVSSRRARLVQMADAGRSGARHALELAAEPTRFLSSVQVGITSIGILSGAIGEASIARQLQAVLEQYPALAAHAEGIALGVMVVALTYVSLIIGELVPKRLALTNPELVASFIASPMQLVAAVGRPIVRILTLSTDGVLRLLGARRVRQTGVTVEEIKVMLEQGAEEGIVEPGEHEMVRNVLNLDERHVSAVLTPRSDVVFADVRDPLELTREKIRQDPHDVLPLCDGSLDNVVGFIRSATLLDRMLENEPFDLSSLAEPPLFVPETTTLLALLEHFKRTRLPAALVVDEFGGVEGIVSLTDVVAAIVGELSTDVGEEPFIVHRDDGSWLIDGAMEIDALWRALDAPPPRAGEEHQQHYHTLGGLAMWVLGRVPRMGDTFEHAGFRFEVVDMDGRRVDRLWVRRLKPAMPDNTSAPTSDDGRRAT
jgi:putative hemolysin